MTATNRLANRVLLALLGVAAVGVGGWIVIRAYPQVLPMVALPELPALDTTALWVVAASAAAAIILALLWMFSRGRGRSGLLLRDASPDGSVEFDVTVASDVLTAALARQPDILSVKVASYRVRRTLALLVTVNARSGCDLPRLRDDVGRALDGLDQLLERRIPVLLHVTSGVRATLAREQRVT
ncbi:hypothetical protein BH11ACT5_BH11ACT5_10440 [soil metagenome]